MDDKKIRIKWNEVDKFEHQTFTTMVNYEVTIQREAIPIIFVPGIMGSRLLQAKSKTSVWDPDNTGGSAWNYLFRGAQHRKDLIVGPSFDPGFLTVAGGRLGQPSDDLGADFVKREFDNGYRTVGWEWAQPNEDMVETADFYTTPPGSTDTNKYVMDDSITKFTDPDNLRHAQYPAQNTENTDSKAGNNDGKRALKNGWAGVAWGFYGKIIERIASTKWTEGGMRKCFYFPTYAFGYNWTQSNRTSGQELAQFISQVIPEEQKGGRLCNYVILVTHSMGGLVARACSELAGAQGKILGIVHGAQPAVGTPAGYHQYRAGADLVPLPLRRWFHSTMSDLIGDLKANAQSNVIGSSAQTTDPIFGHCPGPAELLPAASYRVNKSNKKHSGSAEWLFENGPATPPAPALPNGDPYSSIYENSSDFRGLMTDTSWVLPDDDSSNRKTDLNRRVTSSDVLKKTISTAKGFHGDLVRKCHPVTYYSYSYSPKASSYDEITYTYMRQHMEPQYVPDYSGMSAGAYITDPQSTGQGVDIDPKSKGLYSLAGKSGSGDQTVATSSATSLGAPGGLRPPFPGSKETPDLSYPPNPHIIRICAVPGLEHSGVYQNEEINDFTIKAIADIAVNYMLKTIGKAQKPLWTP